MLRLDILKIISPDKVCSMSNKVYISNKTKYFCSQLMFQ